MKITHEPLVGPLRAKAYPPLTEQLDAIMKGFKALRDAGIALPEETLAWIESCEAVKLKYTK